MRLLSQSHRTWRLATGVVVGSGLLVIPVLLAGPDHQPNALLFAETLVCAVVVGLGRQGIDVLVVRLIATGITVTIGWVIGGFVMHPSPLCANLYECDLLGVSLVFLGLLIATLLAIAAIPTSIVWNRGFTNVRPELAWRRVLVPRTWLHWAVTLGVLALLFAAVFIAFPTPP